MRIYWAEGAPNIMNRPVYLDYNATTPMDPRVLEAIIPYFSEKFGNEASRTHVYGWEAYEAVKKARESIALAVGARNSEEIIFTSGATESNNLALKGLVRASGKKPAHIITQKTEHKCILESCAALEKEGHQVTYLDVSPEGLVSPDDVKKNIRQNTLLCSIMTANNEVGTLQPIAKIAVICHSRGVLFHSDAVQAVGKIPLDVQKEGIDLMSLSSHKIYGPKGIGVLYIALKKPPIPLQALMDGGGHERKKRSGTLNVPGIVGLAKALEICGEEREKESMRLTALRDYFIKTLRQKCEGIRLNGHPTLRLPNNINLTIDYVPAEELISATPEIAFSTGSACGSGESEPSYVIQALGLSEEEANSTVRFGLGRWTTRENIDYAVDKISQAVKKIRGQSIKYEIAQQGV